MGLLLTIDAIGNVISYRSELADPIKVELGLGLAQIIRLDEKTQTLVTKIFLPQVSVESTRSAYN